MSAKKWLLFWSILSICTLITIGVCVYITDPFFHYHKPYTNKFYYQLNNQRSQNNGICKHFDYNAIITGTSMSENFMTSELNELFDVDSVKVCFFGASYKELNDNLQVALENNPNIKLIIRGLDYDQLFSDKDSMRFDESTYPTYLYDNNPFNDVKYLYNQDVVFGRVYSMLTYRNSGITSFDDYSNWQNDYPFGPEYVLKDGITFTPSSTYLHLSKDEEKNLKETLNQNLIALANEYPNVEYYCFIPPYSIVWWNNLNNDGTIYKQIEAEQCFIETILENSNIRLFSFNNRTDITTNLNLYRDYVHYNEDVNSQILHCLKNGEYELTKENYMDYLKTEIAFYTSYDYPSIMAQLK